MCTFLKRLFGCDKEKSSEEKSTNFSIEYYPLSERYYPKYKDSYLRTRAGTGIVIETSNDLFSLAEWFYTEQQAEHYIALFKEQAMKENVVTIKNK